VSEQKRIAAQRKRRTFRVRNAFQGSTEKPRVSVFRSLQHIYAQVIDDANGVTLASFSSLNYKGEKADKKAIAKHVGLELGKMAQEKAIKEVFFDRGRFLYHGRVKALAEGLRESGLKF
jgi:large subunit ribosomal protein L18